MYLQIYNYSIINKEKAKEYLDYLEEKYTEWSTHPMQRSNIASEINEAAMHLDDEIYNYLNPGNATGLFEHYFSESNIQRSIKMLNTIVNEGELKPVNELSNLYFFLLNYVVPEGVVMRKELKDYLLEKMFNGELKGNKISFRDEEDFAYFSKLTSDVGIDGNDALEDIILNAFPQNI